MRTREKAHSASIPWFFGAQIVPENSPTVSPAAIPRIPVEFEGIQVNHCKTPPCSNFGIPAEQTSTRGTASRINPNRYTVIGASAGLPFCRCNACSESFPLKSNVGIVQEADRMCDYLTPKDLPFCPNTDSATHCENHFKRIPVGTLKAYASFGKTEIGNPRYRCNGCRKTFSVNQKPTARQRKTSNNKLIFKMLVNKVPFARISEIADVTPPTLLRRFSFIHEQCLAFAADRERKLLTLPIGRLYIGVDRQDYMVNWDVRQNRRNIVLSAVASVDNATGYCFGLHLNFDSSLNPAKIEADAQAAGDAAKAMPFRTYARLWLEADHQQATAKSKRKKPIGVSLAERIEDAYRIAVDRDDIENSESPTKDETLPTDGMQTRLEYTLYGHFLFMKRAIGNVEKWRFYLDQDSGMRAACLAGFADEIKERRADAFFVKITRDLTIDQKRAIHEKARKAFQRISDELPELETPKAVKLYMIKQQLRSMKPQGKWNDQWLMHPFPSMSEPEKASSYLTDLGDYDSDHLAWLHNKASLHGVDSFFNRIRRRVSILERPLHSSGNGGRVWSGYAAYHPTQAAKALEIMRTVHNFALVGVDKKTPAMRIGLAKAPITFEDILYFNGK
jgi:transposase-like protein